ncbi:hypothetical protein [Prescottella agglutinans]|uniref:Uncharacterized protein n=1 Tax=Prescottella agglutinans TaxID=1644129 RepID=A0ABT6M677_9NOCA|nr:hypothetical protein [Prescottella agglutinans]MDH6279812.1 hypothetical protein [Prescottella agglutinans]
MKARRSKHLLTAAAIAAAVVLGGAIPAAATPNADPLAPITAAASSLASGDSVAPQGITTQTLIAARNAGFPIYEAVQDVVVNATKMGTIFATEYRRVYEIDALNSPTTKFVGVGAIAPDRFAVVHQGLEPIVVNVRPPATVQPFQILTYDATPQTWWNSPLVRLPDGGPSVGIALVR